MVHPGLEELQEVILFVVVVSLPVPGNTALVCYLCSSHAGNNGHGNAGCQAAL